MSSQAQGPFEHASIDSQDTEGLLRLARRRCADEKAAVRKAGVSLLESLLRLRAAAPAHARELPAEADIAAIEAATADPLVQISMATSAIAPRRTLTHVHARHGQKHPGFVSYAGAYCLPARGRAMIKGKERTHRLNLFVHRQVSVRRAGLGVATRLLRELPHETAVAELWVRAALPLVRRPHDGIPGPEVMPASSAASPRIYLTDCVDNQAAHFSH